MLIQGGNWVGSKGNIGVNLLDSSNTVRHCRLSWGYASELFLLGIDPVVNDHFNVDMCPGMSSRMV